MSLVVTKLYNINNPGASKKRIEYDIKSGKKIDYIVDYGNDKKFMFYRSNASFGPIEDEMEENQNIHEDRIGEYQAEFVRVRFDETSIEVQENFDEFRTNKEIKKIDLNRVGLKSHILREG